MGLFPRFTTFGPLYPVDGPSYFLFSIVFPSSCLFLFLSVTSATSTVNENVAGFMAMTNSQIDGFNPQIYLSTFLDSKEIQCSANLEYSMNFSVYSLTVLFSCSNFRKSFSICLTAAFGQNIRQMTCFTIFITFP